jgi:hypothetical protein
MRKFTNKQLAEVDRLLDEAFYQGYEAAEFDAKHRAEFEKVFNDEEVINSLFTAEANMKRAEAEYNKREPIGFDEHGQSWYLDYGTPDELYTFWGVRDDH